MACHTVLRLVDQSSRADSVGRYSPYDVAVLLLITQCVVYVLGVTPTASAGSSYTRDWLSFIGIDGGVVWIPP